jgi:hypothetical protein
MDLKISEMAQVATLNDNDVFPMLTYPFTPTSNRSGSWSLVKSMLKTYFDPIYASAGTYEFVINKKTDLTAPDNIGYPTTLAVDNVRANLQGQINVISGGVAGAELLINKRNDLVSPNATTYPTTFAVDAVRINLQSQIDTLATAPSSWKLDGTTVGAEKFIGTLDNFEFPIRVNNVEKVRVVSNGAVYAANFSETFTNRHLIDKEYVDNIGAINFSRYRANTGSLAAADPGIGNIRWNNLTQNLATELYIDSLTDGFGINVDAYFALITPDSMLYIQKQNDATQYQRWRVMSANNMTGWWKFVVQSINSNGGNIVNSAPILLGINLSPSAYSGSSWGWDGSTVGVEKWLGTKDNFEMPVRVNSVEVARFKTNGFHIGVAGSSEARFVLRAISNSTANCFVMEDSTGINRFTIADNGYTAITSSSTQIMDVNFGGSTVFDVHSTGIGIGNSASIQSATFGTPSLSGTGFRFNANGSNGSEHHFFRGGVSASNSTLIDFSSITDNLLSGTNTGRVFRIRVNIDSTSTGQTWNYFEVSPAINSTIGSMTLKGIVYSPTLTGTVGLTHYGMLIQSGLVGIGTATPTAKFQVKGTGITTGELCKMEDSAGTERFKILDSGDTTISGDASSGVTLNSKVVSSIDSTIPFKLINDTGVDSAVRYLAYFSKRWNGAGTPDSNNGAMIAFGIPNSSAVEKVAITWRYQLTGITGAENSNFFIQGYVNGVNFQNFVRVGGGLCSVGEGAQVVGSGDTAYGVLAKTNNNQGTSVGYEAANTSGTFGTRAITIGYQSNKGTHNIGQDAITIGYLSRGRGVSQICIGRQGGITSGTIGANVIGIGDFNFGDTSNVGDQSIGIGNRVSTSAVGAIVMGYGVVGSTFLVNSVADSFALGWSTITPTILLAKAVPSYINNTFGLVIGGNVVTNANTILDIQSTTKGVTFPRMTTTQRDAITGAYAGLMIYNSTTNRLNMHDGTNWREVQLV